MIQLINCILVASTSATPQVIVTNYTRITTTVPTMLYRCERKPEEIRISIRNEQILYVDYSRPLRRVKVR